jgi:hypothetical protein
MRRPFAAALLAAALAAAPAMAQTAAPQAAAPQAQPAKQPPPKGWVMPEYPLHKLPSNMQNFTVCTEDYQRFCKDIVPGDGSIGKCLRAHYMEVSPACYAKMQEIFNQPGYASAPPACKYDVYRYCSGMQGAQVQACLASNAAKLNLDCARELKLPAPPAVPAAPPPVK